MLRRLLSLLPEDTVCYCCAVRGRGTSEGTEWGVFGGFFYGHLWASPPASPRAPLTAAELEPTVHPPVDLWGTGWGLSAQPPAHTSR